MPAAPNPEAFADADRPFADLDALAEAAGKTRSDLWMPSALTTASNCFRIASDATYTAVNGNKGVARVEAVVMFDGGEYKIIRWSAERLAAPSAPASEEDSEETETV